MRILNLVAVFLVLRELPVITLEVILTDEFACLKVAFGLSVTDENNITVLFAFHYSKSINYSISIELVNIP
jgi:hypothetical protein